MYRHIGWILLLVVTAVAAICSFNTWHIERQIRAGDELVAVSQFQLLGDASNLLRHHYQLNDALTGYVSADHSQSLSDIGARIRRYQTSLMKLDAGIEYYNRTLRVYFGGESIFSNGPDEISSLMANLETTGVPLLSRVERMLPGLRPGDYPRLAEMRTELGRLDGQIIGLHGTVSEKSRHLADVIDGLHSKFHQWLVATGLAFAGCLLAFGGIFYQQLVEKRRDARKLSESHENLTHQMEQARRLTEELVHQSAHDPVSGMLNRRGFTDKVSNILEHGRGSHGLAMLDLDMFKVINDTSGHSAGDEVLRDVGRLLSSVVPESCTMARLGSDEFLLFVEFCTFKEFDFLLNRISNHLLRYRFRYDGHIYDVNGSIGAIHLDEGQHDLENLLLHADSACYMAKRTGGSRIAYSDGESTPLKARQEDRDWAEKILKALENDRFKLFYQTIVNVDMNAGLRTHSWELLLRMIDDNGNIIPPGMFLGVAERFSLAPRIDRWVIRNAFDWLNENSHGALLFECISINLSGLSIGDYKFLDFIEQQSTRLKVPANKICFEITESAVVGDDAIAFLQRLKDLGFQIALDDFGRGHSSFGYLENLPVDYIKIDGTFVKDIELSESHEAFVRAINSVGKAMKKATVAEFVESSKAMKILADIGVDYAQGYFIAKPQELPDSLERAEIRVA